MTTGETELRESDLGLSNIYPEYSYEARIRANAEQPLSNEVERLNELGIGRALMWLPPEEDSKEERDDTEDNDEATAENLYDGDRPEGVEFLSAKEGTPAEAQLVGYIMPIGEEGWGGREHDGTHLSMYTNGIMAVTNAPASIIGSSGRDTYLRLTESYRRPLVVRADSLEQAIAAFEWLYYDKSGGGYAWNRYLDDDGAADVIFEAVSTASRLMPTLAKERRAHDARAARELKVKQLQANRQAASVGFVAVAFSENHIAEQLEQAGLNNLEDEDDEE